MRRLFFAGVATGLFFLAATSAYAQWNVAPDAPLEMSQNAVVADDSGNLYTFNGQTTYNFLPPSVTPALDCAFVFNVCNGTWDTISFPGWTSYGGNAVFLDGAIYWQGGVNAAPGSFSRYDIDTDSYTVLTNAPTSTNSFAPAVVADTTRGLIHWIGGEDFGSEHNIYDPLSDSWSSAAPPLVGGFGHVSVYDDLNDRIVLLGGWAGNNEETGAATNATQIYNPDTNSWTLGTAVPGPGRYMAAGDIDPSTNLITIWGGSSNYFNGSPAFFNDGPYTYSVATNTWVNLNDLNPSGGNREMGAAYDSLGLLHFVGGNTYPPTFRHEYYGNLPDADNDGVDECLDCDDNDPNNYPGNTEVCDGGDNDCDGDIDENAVDADNDGVDSCDDCDDSDGASDEGFDQDNDGWTTCGGDCDDNNPGANPDCPDICNGIDDDCDGSIDEDFDVDGDGVTTCAGDCDDHDPDTYTGAPELCDGLDNDCDGVIPADETDDDGDGASECEGDCDDGNDEVYEGAFESCNGVDDDCDGDVDEGYDDDGDGVTSCDGDCDDTNPDAYPGAEELCDNVDTDCDGAADNGFDDDGDGIPDCIDECPMDIDFDTDPWGDSIASWTDVTDTYMNWGVTIEQYDDPNLEISTPAIAADIGVPALGNVMAAADDANTWWIVNFSSSTCVHSIDLAGVAPDELAAQVILFDVNVQTIATYTASGLGDTSLETVDLGGTCGVFVMLIDFYDSGAWDNLQVCVDPTGTEEVCDDGEDNDGDGEVDEDCDASGDDDDDDVDDDDEEEEEEEDGDGGEEGDPDCSMAGERSGSGLLALLLLGLLGGLRATSEGRRVRSR